MPELHITGLNTPGKRIHALRKAKGLKVRELGAIVGVDHSTVSAYERGEYRPPADKIIRLAKALSIPVGWLLTGHGEAHVDYGSWKYKRGVYVDHGPPTENGK